MVYTTEYWNQDDDEFADDVSLLDLEDQLEKLEEKLEENGEENV